MSDLLKKNPPYPGGIFEVLDVTDLAHYKYLMEKHQINYIIHLSAILSATGEQNPFFAMKVNCEGAQNALDMAKTYNAK
jgi:nucleoside-diphosphate-sugar epimerase